MHHLPMYLCRKVPSDLNRMTILQRYLASIGVISVNSSGKTGKGMPSLGSGYPSSSSSQFFHNHVAHAARPSSRAGRTAAGSPSTSQQYDEYTEGSGHMQQIPLYHQPAVDMDEGDNQHQQQYEQYQQYEQHYQHCEQQYEQNMYEGNYSVEEDNAEGAAAGLLQLARAALMHLEEDEQEDAAASYQNKHESDEVADNEYDQQQDEVGSGKQQFKHKPAGRQPGAGLFIRPEPVVRSNSEDSAHTAEDEEGSPMAEANLKLQLQQRKPSSNLIGKRLPTSGEQLSMLGAPGAKRHRPMWEQGPCGPAPHAISRLSRPVLDVSEPHFAAPSTIAADASSPASPPMTASAKGVNHAGLTGQQSDAQSQLLAIMMQAFMGAAATEGNTSATALSPNHLAAVARIMALSGLALGGQGCSAGTPAAVACEPQAAVADVLAALAQQGAANIPAAGTPASAWSASSLEQQVRTAGH